MAKYVWRSQPVVSGPIAMLVTSTAFISMEYFVKWRNWRKQNHFWDTQHVQKDDITKYFFAFLKDHMESLIWCLPKNSRSVFSTLQQNNWAVIKQMDISNLTTPWTHTSGQQPFFEQFFHSRDVKLSIFRSNAFKSTDFIGMISKTSWDCTGEESQRNLIWKRPV